MGTKLNPGKYDCLDRCEPDEPNFLLLARDVAAPNLVRQWAKERAYLISVGRKPASDSDMVSDAMALADEMDAWRIKHRES